MKMHKLKTWVKPFIATKNGSKTFEVRKNDRGFKVGDKLVLREYKNKQKKYTGRSICVRVEYLTSLDNFLPVRGYVGMTVRVLPLTPLGYTIGVDEF